MHDRLLTAVTPLTVSDDELDELGVVNKTHCSLNRFFHVRLLALSDCPVPYEFEKKHDHIFCQRNM